MKTGRIGWVAIAAFLWGAVLLAQGLPTASLTGKVTTEGGVALPGVTVKVESPRLQGARDTTTGVNGDYIFNLLPPGDYTVRFELSGMTAIERPVALPANGSARLDVEMRPAAVSETVTVWGPPPTRRFSPRRRSPAISRRTS